MRVLKQNPADPFGDGEEKHVVTEGGRPIGHGQADAFARDHSTAANEEQRAERGEPGESIEPGTGVTVCDRRTR